MSLITALDALNMPMPKFKEDDQNFTVEPTSFTKAFETANAPMPDFGTFRGAGAGGTWEEESPYTSLTKQVGQEIKKNTAEFLSGYGISDTPEGPTLAREVPEPMSIDTILSMGKQLLKNAGGFISPVSGPDNQAEPIPEPKPNVMRPSTAYERGLEEQNRKIGRLAENAEGAGWLDRQVAGLIPIVLDPANLVGMRAAGMFKNLTKQEIESLGTKVLRGTGEGGTFQMAQTPIQALREPGREAEAGVEGVSNIPVAAALGGAMEGAVGGYSKLKERSARQKIAREVLLNPNGIDKFVAENPEMANTLASIESPSRRDFKAAFGDVALNKTERTRVVNDIRDRLTQPKPKEPATKVEPEAVAPSPKPEPTPDFDAMHFTELQAMAKELGITNKGTREALIRDIKAAKGLAEPEPAGGLTGAELDQYTYAELQGLAKEFGIRSKGTRQSLVKSIKEKWNENPEPGEPTGPSAVPPSADMGNPAPNFSEPIIKTAKDAPGSTIIEKPTEATKKPEIVEPTQRNKALDEYIYGDAPEHLRPLIKERHDLMIEIDKLDKAAKSLKGTELKELLKKRDVYSDRVMQLYGKIVDDKAKEPPGKAPVAQDAVKAEPATGVAPETKAAMSGGTPGESRGVMQKNYDASPAVLPNAINGITQLDPIPTTMVTDLVKVLTSKYPELSNRLKSSLALFRTDGKEAVVKVSQEIFPKAKIEVLKEELAQDIHTKSWKKLDPSEQSAITKSTEYKDGVDRIYADYEKELPQILSHEGPGHALDALQDAATHGGIKYDLKRGNLLGSLLKLQKFVKGSHPGAITTNPELRAEGKALSQWWRPWDPKTADKSTIAYRNSARELYADAMSTFMVAPKEFQARAPKLFQAILDHMNKNPEFADAYKEYQGILAKGPEALSEYRFEQTAKDFEKGVILQQEAKAKHDKTRLGFGASIRKAVDDTWQPAINMAKDLPDKVNRGKILRDEWALKDNIGNLQTHDLNETVIKPMKEAGITPTEAGAIMLNDRVAFGDRSGIGNPHGITPEAAKADLGWLQKEMGPGKWKAAQDALQEFHTRNMKIMENASKEGVVSPETLKMAQENFGHYGTFTTLDHIADGLKGTIQRQVGTFNEVGNPFFQTIYKAEAISRLTEITRIKKGMVELVREVNPNMVLEPTVSLMAKGEPHAPIGMENFPVMKDGKLTYYQIPKEIAGIFNNKPTEAMKTVANAAQFLHGYLHAVWVKYSPLFQALNPIRDIGRLWQDLPTKIRGAGKGALEYHRAKAEAIAYKKKGVISPRLREMFENKEIGFDTFVGGIDKKASLDPIQEMLMKHGITPDNAPMKSASAIRKILNWMETRGEIQEVKGKLAASRTAEWAGLSGTERANFVRNRAGTPNFRVKGEWSPILNTVFPYSNVWKEALKNAVEIGTSKGTRTGFWTKTLMVDLTPKVLMKLGSIGVFGAAVAEAYKLIPSYYMKNYTVVPIGTRTNEKTGKKEAIFFTLPMTDFGKLLGSPLWTGLDNPKLDVKTLSGIFSSGYGELPSISPLITIPTKAAQAASGTNPTDYRQGRPIVRREAWAYKDIAPGQSMIDFGKWAGSQFGIASTISKTTIGKPWEDQPLTERAIGLAGDLTGLSRFIRVSGAGERETKHEILAADQSQKAYLHKQKSDMVDTELSRLGLDPGVPKKELENPLTSEEYEGLAKAIKARSGPMVERLIASEEYQEMDDDKKRIAVDKEFDKAQRIEMIRLRPKDSDILAYVHEFTSSTPVRKKRNGVFTETKDEFEARVKKDAREKELAQEELNFFNRDYEELLQAEYEAKSNGKTPPRYRNGVITDYGKRLRRLKDL